MLTSKTILLCAVALGLATSAARAQDEPTAAPDQDDTRIAAAYLRATTASAARAELERVVMVLGLDGFERDGVLP